MGFPQSADASEKRVPARPHSLPARLDSSARTVSSGSSTKTAKCPPFTTSRTQTRKKIHNREIYVVSGTLLAVIKQVCAFLSFLCLFPGVVGICKVFFFYPDVGGQRRTAAEYEKIA